ncbi:serine hydrolase [Allosalinactinospora lopnorensis]|uniref:serine hydrolase n=1 Tax=Allosalinactinospora lopnorensis TaxID=1352348 RepID=UPI00069890AF|nr:serine hydrolase [Allosalinactinospora lopnorensis]
MSELDDPGEDQRNPEAPRPRWRVAIDLALLAAAFAAVLTFALLPPLAGEQEEQAETPPPPQPSATDDEVRLTSAEEERITGGLDGYLADREGRLALSVQELTTGITYDYQADREFVTGSLVKLDILALLLLQAEDEERELTRQERELAGQMIRYSDNNVADTLYELIGFDTGLTEGNERIGLRDTEPGAGGVWGATTTTAADQRNLLRSIFTNDGLLSEASRGYARELLDEVAPEQAWGVSVAGDPETAELKNGWVPLESDGGRWAINSAGRVAVGDQEYLIAVLSDHHLDYGSGVECVEHAVTEVIDAIERKLD